MSNVILVQSNGKKSEGIVAEKKTVHFASEAELDTFIESGVEEVASILSGKVEDPTMKKCSRCVKKGRMPYYPVEDFSLLKNGKRHSQCKVCRTEQATEWCNKRAEHRREYHKEYNKIRTPPVRRSEAVKLFIEATAEADGLNTNQALFVAMPNEDIEATK